MTAPFPYPIGGGTVALEYTFPAAEAMAAAGWVMTGDPAPAEVRPVTTWWDSPHAFPYISGQVLFGWVDGDPFFRSTFQTASAIALGMTPLAPGQRVYVTFRAVWSLGSGFDGGAWVGSDVNGIRGNLNGPIFGGGVRTFTIETEADQDGDLIVAIGVDKMNPSLNVDHSWRSFTISTAGFDPDPFSSIIVNAATLVVDDQPLSITRGGASFDPQIEYEDYDFPGKAAPVVGLDEVVSQRPVIRATVMLTGEAQILKYDPGGEWYYHESVSGGRTYLPTPMRVALGESVYLTDVACIWKRQGGDFIAVEFPFALCRKYGIHSRDKDEGEIAIEIEARQSADDLRAPLYLIHILPSTYTLDG